VLQWLVEAADQLRAFARYVLHDVRVRQVQLDELFALLSAVKDGEVSAADAIERLERTPQWVWVAMDPESKLLLAVVFQKWRWPFLHRPSKGIAIDKQANHDVMHLRGFREADRLANQAFDACPQCQVLALDLLGVPFARTMHVGSQMPSVRPQIVRVLAGEAEWLQQRLELQQDLVFAAPKDVG